MRLGCFYFSKIQPYKSFASHFVGQLLMMDRLVKGDIDHMYLHVCVLVSEVLRLGWPQHYVANAMNSISRCHQSDLVRAIRTLGRAMRKCSFSTLVDYSELLRKATDNPMQTRVLSCMAVRNEVKEQPLIQKELFPFTRAAINMFFR